MGYLIGIADLPAQLQRRSPGGGDREDWPLSLEEVRKQHIQSVVAMCKGNRLRASQFQGIWRTSLYRYLKQDGYDDAVKARSATNGR